MNPIRAFIALELNAEVQQKLGALMLRLKGPRTGAVRWVPAQNIHLTLKFLGDVPPGEIDALKKMLTSAIPEQAPLHLVLSGIGAFPNPRRPRVIWAGLQAPPELPALARLVEKNCAALGFAPEDRPFSPHLTLGRVSQNATPEQVAQIAEMLSAIKVGEVGTCDANEVVLFRSDLKPSGAEYTPLFKRSLNPTA